MPFNQEPVNYAQEYARELAQAYPYLSYFADLYNSENSNRYRPAGGNGVWIPSITTSGARAVNRDAIDGVFTRNANINWELKTMRMYREWDTIIDPMDVVETNDVLTIANVTRAFNEFQKVPEMDAYAASHIAEYAGEFGGVDSTTLTSANILAQWDDALKYMAEQRVNRDRVRCKVTPAVYVLLKQAAGITRFIEITNGIQAVDRNVAKLDGVLIQEVPSDIMQSAFDFTIGWVKAAGSSTIGMLLYDPQSLIAPISYETAMMSPPTAQSKGKNVYYESYYYDVFKLNNRQAGLFAFMAAPSLGTVVVTSKAGTAASGDTVITASGSEIGSYGVDIYYTAGNNAAVSCTYGAALPNNGATWVKADSASFTLKSQTAGKYVTVALVNRQTQGVIAAGSAVEVVKA